MLSCLARVLRVLNIETPHVNHAAVLRVVLKPVCVLVQALTDYMSKQLEGRVSKVAVSARLTDSPCILVTSKSGWSANMQRIMKSQPMQDGRALDYMKGDKIMEINPENAVRYSSKYSPIARISRAIWLGLVFKNAATDLGQ